MTGVSSSHFDAIASAYDESLPAHVVEHYLQKRVAFVLAHCPRGRALDVGCGTGVLAARLAASGYELAVHALDLRAPRPDPRLLDAGLAALVDVTGVFAHRRGLRTALTAWVGGAGWQVRTGPDGWVTVPVAGSRPGGAAVEGDAATLLDASAGRLAVPALLAARSIRVHGLADVIRLAPIVEDVPGLPGGPALRAAARWLGGAGRLLPRLGF
jgi:SAM-dependent methyltransferase